MNHSLIIDEVLAHPQDVSWLPWAVQYFFFIGIAAWPRCSHAFSTGAKKKRQTWRI